MNIATQKNEILIARGIHGVRDIDMTLLVNDQNGKSFILRGLEATIWDWLTLNYSYNKIVGLLATIFDLPICKTEFRLNSILREWVEKGLLKTQENIHHG